jgi:hypothetical protein
MRYQIISGPNRGNDDGRDIIVQETRVLALEARQALGGWLVANTRLILARLLVYLISKILQTELERKAVLDS